jgi:tetratricopeptide (TPR) repeat protein
MNCFGQRLFLPLVTLFMTVVSGGAESAGIDTLSSQMTVPQARKALIDSLNHIVPTSAGSKALQVRDLKIGREQATFVIDYDTPVECCVRFAEMDKLEIRSVPLSKRSRVMLNGRILSFDQAKPGFYGPNSEARFQEEKYARTFIEAVIALKNAAQARGSDETDFAAFTVAAKTWLATTPRPEMSDEARTYKLLAEDAFKRQDMKAALEAYGDALDIHPMWPEGHYNAALLAAETKDYGSAANHMRRYLVLAPNAKDARAAKDKLLLWQHKAKE